MRTFAIALIIGLASIALAASTWLPLPTERAPPIGDPQGGGDFQPADETFQVPVPDAEDPWVGSARSPETEVPMVFDETKKILDDPEPGPASAAPGCRSFPAVPRGTTSMELDEVITGLTRPLQLVSARDGTGRSYIVQQGGQVLTLCGGMVSSKPLLDISHLVSDDEEAGLLSIALWPPTGETKAVFAFFNREDNDIVIARYPMSPNYDEALVEQGEVVLHIPSGPGSHYGGTLAFGPDGYLYISVGDTDAQDNPSNTAQDLEALQGKILRIDVAESPYAIPASNPFSTGGGRPEIVAYGLRNPWRMSFDTETGDLWIGDVGNSLAEEINILRAGELRVNFGWRVWEGNERRHEDEVAPNATAPYYVYAPTRGSCANTGGIVYRGETYPSLYGKFVYADFCHDGLLALQETDEGPAPFRVASAPRLIVGLSVDEEGALFAITRLGTILRLEPTTGAEAA